MPNCFGIRCLYDQARRGFREGRDFDVRYWMPAELNSIFRTIFDPPEFLRVVIFAQPTNQRCTFSSVEISHSGLRFGGIAQD
jgi:hypothetical protein